MTPTTRLPLVAALRASAPLMVDVAKMKGLWPGDNDFEDAAGYMLQAAALIEKQGALVAELVNLVNDYRAMIVSDYEISSGFSEYWAGELSSIDAALLAAKTLGERE